MVLLSIMLGLGALQNEFSKVPLSEPVATEVIKLANFPQEWLGRNVKVCGELYETASGPAVSKRYGRDYEAVYVSADFVPTVNADKESCFVGNFRRVDGRSRSQEADDGAAGSAVHEIDERFKIFPLTTH